MARSSRVAVSAIYGAALLSSAVLIFWIEPLFAKLILPVMGGAPATWMTALMLYQGVVFAGYAYSYILTRAAPRRLQIGIHALALILAAPFLPPHLTTATALFAERPVLQVTFLLALGVGLPLFALAATAPLLQQWLATSDHPDAKDPFFLYGASNLGSLGALLAYPFLIEPYLGAFDQTRWWTMGYGLAAALVIGGGVLTKHRMDAAAEKGLEAEPMPGRPSHPALWLILAAVPASLLSGATTVITADIAAGPLFWVAPLALYLLSFVLAFARRRLIGLRAALIAQAILFAFVIAHAFGLNTPLGGSAGTILLPLAALFLSAYLCHARLADSHPPSGQAAKFYLWIAAGGLLGGSFNALIAPNLFTDGAEYFLALVMAAALRPDPAPKSGKRKLQLWEIAGLAALGPVIALVIYLVPTEDRNGVGKIIAVFFLIALVPASRRPMRIAALLLATFVVGELSGLSHPPLYRARNFFGIVKIWHDAAADTNSLVNGGTTHGLQYRAPALRREPTTYYSREGPLGDVAAMLGAAGRMKDVAAIGLGAGTVACLGDADTRWTFYEINPLIVRIAEDDRYFTYLKDCAPGARIEKGDGRLLLARAHGLFDLVILDAFNSDALPIHLLTREAFVSYLDRLAPRGVIAVHITNGNIDLTPVLAGTARSLGLAGMERVDRPGADRPHAFESDWIALAREPSDLAPLSARPGWLPLAAARPILWTDDHADLLSPILARQRGGG